MPYDLHPACEFLMPIKFTCPHCGHRTSASEAYAGSSGPCVQCGVTIKLPGDRADLASPGRLADIGRTPDIGDTPVVAQAPDAVPTPGKSTGCMSTVLLVLVALGMVMLLFAGMDCHNEPRRRSECNNNLKRIGIALLGYYDEHRSFPPAYITDENGQPMHSWRVLILPYMEQSALYAEYDFDEPWDGPHNRRLMAKCPAEFHCPSDPSDKKISRYQVVVGPGTGWKANEGLRIEEITDGTSLSIAVIEADTGRNWLDPTPLALEDLLLSFDRREPHPGGGNVVMFDASVHFLHSDTGRDTLRRMLLINDGERVNF
ncbi:DUF1559 family PulG-like putative transporter [Lignipirellula cremea]|uniref:DUF1559 domain-containing protein n=1 Tax=Lignipirellula cremea TaxID=2528010 RepID=A0A518DU22_9BACT|nr:DUF1559 domain-containing protein [Lignipirellula cremea]QDU95337.1 hypothetical protein Pla8534_31520 [Lignipirellula cremea]